MNSFTFRNFFFLLLKLCACMYISVWDCEQVRVGAQGVQIKVSDYLECELQAIVSHTL